MKQAFVTILCALPAIQNYAWSVLSGVIGTLILAGFFSMIMSLELLSVLLPMIVAVNASISGYMLVDRAEVDMTRKHSTAVAVGMAVAVLSFVSINAFCLRTGGFFLMSTAEALIAVALAGIGACAGSVLAVKYKALKAQQAG
jgi:hypothetical protein